MQGHAALHLVSEHKRTALLSDPESLIKRCERLEGVDQPSAAALALERCFS